MLSITLLTMTEMIIRKNVFNSLLFFLTIISFLKSVWLMIQAILYNDNDDYVLRYILPNAIWIEHNLFIMNYC